jgi:sortase (surface protein transpeptidase)
LRKFGFLSIGGAVIGATVFAAGLACSGGDKKTEASLDSPTDAPAVATNTATPTATATATPSPTATPTPFNGRVARMQIPKLKVDAPIEELAINSRNELETPKAENTNVGWYHIYDKPGFGGNALFSAHVYYHSIPAPFQRLASTVTGDEIKVVMEDGTTYTYKVVSNKRYNRDTIPMGEIIWPPSKAKEAEWITMITCGGQLDSTGQEYVDRDVIVAERVS